MKDDHVIIMLPVPVLGAVALIVAVAALSGLVRAMIRRDDPPSDWLHRLQDRTGLGSWHPVAFGIVSLTWAIVAVTLFFGIYLILWQIILHAPPTGTEAVWTWRFAIAQLAALTTVLGGVIALPITLNRLILARRQTETTEQGHITDRINKAIEQLGNAEPAVRMGAILSLDRIMADSAHDRLMVLNMLNAYISHHQPAGSGGAEDPVMNTGIHVQAALDVMLKWNA